MSLTVRYPNGQAITYNRANVLRYGPHCWQLYYKDAAGRETWIASVQPSAGAVIESEPACRVENPLHGQGDPVSRWGPLTPQAAVNFLLEHLDQLDRRRLSELKRVLRAFDARGGHWRRQDALPQPGSGGLSA